MPDAPKADDRPKTRYLIYSTPDNGRTLNMLGDQLALSSDQALRSFFADTTPEGVYTAISENSVKLRIRKVEQVTRATIEEVGSPQTPLAGHSRKVTEPEDLGL